jgi:hypothetical protein
VRRRRPLPVGAGRGGRPAHVLRLTCADAVASCDQCEFPAILGAHEAVARWVKESGRELVGPPREVNVFGDGEPMRMEITYPLR